MKFVDKTAVITGASGGLGRFVVQSFIDEGSAVLAIARNAGDLSSLGKNKLEFFAADVTREVEMEKCLENVPIVDFFIHCAGGFKAGAPLWKTAVADWDFMMNLNLKSAFLASRAVMKKMTLQGHGKIVFISAMTIFDPKPNRAAYIVSKAGLATLTQVLALEGKDYNIQVNTIAPSIIDTQANRDAMPDMDASRWVAPSDIAATILFLCSAEADGITGTVVKMPGRV
jgi:NAD(P)-dependent dehydrogenase (short-subunit alcohol dehydrogenase family)